MLPYLYIIPKMKSFPQPTWIRVAEIIGKANSFATPRLQILPVLLLPLRDLLWRFPGWILRLQSLRLPLHQVQLQHSFGFAVLAQFLRIERHHPVRRRTDHLVKTVGFKRGSHFLVLRKYKRLNESHIYLQLP